MHGDDRTRVDDEINRWISDLVACVLEGEDEAGQDICIVNLCFKLDVRLAPSPTAEPTMAAGLARMTVRCTEWGMVRDFIRQACAAAQRTLAEISTEEEDLQAGLQAISRMRDKALRRYGGATSV